MVRGEYGVFLGLEVGKGEHHAVGLTPDGKRLHDAPSSANAATTHPGTPPRSARPTST
jgi:hypothetical protein